MATISNRVIKIAYIWSTVDKDKELCDEVETLLKKLERQGIIEFWHSGQIRGGVPMDEEKEAHLQNAQIVLLLVSSDFLTPGDHQSQVSIVMRRYEQELATIGKDKAVTIIPIILRTTDLEGESFARFKALPDADFPINHKHWHDRDEALQKVEKGIREVIDKLQKTTDPMQKTELLLEVELPLSNGQQDTVISRPPASVKLQRITDTVAKQPIPIEPNTNSLIIGEPNRSVFTEPQADAQLRIGQAIQNEPDTDPPVSIVQDGVPSPIEPQTNGQVTNRDTVDPGWIKQTVLPIPPSTPFPSLLPVKPKRRPPLWFFVLIPLMLAVVLIGSFLLYPAINGIYIIFFSPSATVTIIPASKALSRSFSLTAVAGTPDGNQNQLQARQLSYTSPSQTQTASATGAVNILGVQAKGKLTFYNGTIISQTIVANTPIADVNGVQVANDATVTIPPAQPPVEGQVTVAAHAVDAGANGNIPALDINRDCCISSDAIYVKNLSPFTSGKDGQNYTYVQQSDIDDVAHTLEKALTPAAQLSLQRQLHSNEALVTSPVSCTDKVSSDHKAGDKVDQVTVTVIVTCTDETYDKQATESVASHLLKQDAIQDPGIGYALEGSIKTEVMKAAVIDADKGTVAIQVTAMGLWVYQFDSTLKLRLAKLIAGKTEQEATNLLEQQVGVAKLNGLNIDLNRINNNTLPTDPSKITIVIGSP